MFYYIIQFFAPLIALLLISIGTSLLGTTLILQLKDINAPTITIGLLTTFFYSGYIIGAFKLEPFIRRVGHIRAYATFAAIIAATSLLHGFYINAEFWLALRLIYGFCSAGLFMVVESWMLNLSSVEIRGRILSLYMVSFYIAQSFGQFLLKVINIELDAEILFPYAIISITAALSVVPLCSTRSSSPQFEEFSVLSIKDMFALSKSAIIGVFVSGLIFGVIYGILPFSIHQFGYTSQQIGIAMGVLILGGALLQYPIGKISDYVSRFTVLNAITILTLLCAIGLHFTIDYNFLTFNLIIFFFGGFSFTIYPIATNLLCDYVDSKDLMAAIAALLIFYSIGAASGPFLGPIFINLFGPDGIFYFFYSSCAILILATFARSFVRKPMPIAEQSEFVLSSRTTPVATELDPRVEEDPESEEDA